MDDYRARQPRELGRARPGARRLARLRRRPLRRRPGVPERRRHASTCRGSATSRGSRRAPAVPHRHRHGLARAARRAHDRPRLLAAGARARAAALAAAAGRRRRLRRGRRLRRARGARPARFDLVYTGIGALCWLPDIRRWAQVVAEPAAARWPAVHPRGPSGAVVARRRAPRRPARRSSTRTSSRRSRSSGTRAAPTWRPTRVHRTTSTHEWNHGLGEIVTALLDAGMTLTGLDRARQRPWDALPGQMDERRRRRVAAHRPARAAAAHLHAAGPQAGADERLGGTRPKIARWE